MSDLKSPLRTIREHCVECSGTANEVKLCPCEHCKLWLYRFGHDPRRERRQLSPEEKKAIADRMKNGRRDEKEKAE